MALTCKFNIGDDVINKITGVRGIVRWRTDSIFNRYKIYNDSCKEDSFMEWLSFNEYQLILYSDYEMIRGLKNEC